MTAVALKGLLGRKLRSILTGLAIVLGVAMISGTFILTDTINKAFTNVFSVSYRHSDAIVSGKQFVSQANSIPTVPASVLGRVRALPDVTAASGSYLFDTVKLVDRQGKTIASGGAPSLGFGIDPNQPRFNPITLAAGHWAQGPGQVVIGISVAAKPGVSESRLAAEIKPLLPPAAQVRTGSQASHDAAQITAGTRLVKYILLAFGAVALFVGAFVIFNTISITVAQRTRELATLRTLGASRRQQLDRQRFVPGSDGVGAGQSSGRPGGLGGAERSG